MKVSQPKDIKRSVRDKYQARLRRLTLAVEDYEVAAAARIAQGGKIRDREEIEALLAAIAQLKLLLPQEAGVNEEVNRKLSEVFNVEYVPLDGSA